MPRKSRLNVPGAVYHVMARCLGHVRLFPDDEDREFFLSLLGRYLERTGTQCYVSALRIRHRGTKCSDARKGFAYAAAKEYHTPLGIIAEYLDVGRTAVSAMCREGKEILERYKINI
jgi:hypothetical protein